MYAAGNVGSMIAPLPVVTPRKKYSWAMGFGLAVGMIAGLVIFLCGNRHFTHTRGVKKVLRATNFLLPNWGRLLVLLVATPAPITVLFWGKERPGIRLNCRDYYWPGCTGKKFIKTNDSEGAGLIVTLTFFKYVVLGLRTTGR